MTCHPATRGNSWRQRTVLALLALWAAVPPALAQSPVDYVHPQPAQQQSRQTLSGSVVVPDTANLSPAVAGLVKSVAVRAGDRVRAGDLLLTLDPELAQLALEQAKAATAAARVQRQEAQRLRDEGERLAQRGDLSRSQQDARAAEFERLSAELQRLEAIQRERQALLQRHQIKAPFDGTVVARMTAPGEWLNPGTAVLRLVGDSAAEVQLRIAQALHDQLQEGDPATIHLPGVDTAINAQLVRISGAIDPNSRTALVRVKPTERAERLKAGQAVTVTLFPGQAQNAVSIPNDAVLRYPDGSRIVWVLEQSDGNTIARRRQLKLGNTANEFVLVLDGLDTQDRVVVRGNEALKDGQSVEAHLYPSKQPPATQP